MINQDLNSKIDELIAVPSEATPSAQLDQPEQSLPDESTFTGETEQVAGGIGALKGLLKGGGAVKKAIKRGAIVKEQIAKPVVTPTEQVKELSKATEMSGIATREQAKKAGVMQQKIEQEPTITPEQLQQKVDENIQVIEQSVPAQLKPPVQQFNLPLISDSTDFQSVVKSVTDLAGVKTENITFDDVVLSAKAAGMDEKFISDLTSGKLTVDPKNTYLALEAQKASGDHLSELLRKINDNPAAVTPEEELEAVQTIAFHSLIQRSVKGYQTNVAQSLAVMRIPRTGFIDLAEATGNLMDGTALRKFAAKYMDENLDAAGRSKLIDTMASSGYGDKLMSVWINGILSRPATHVKNALSNTLMLPVRMAEKTGAAAVGTTRRAFGVGTEEQYYFTELYSQLSATTQAIKDGAQLASKSFKQGYPATMTDATKISLTKARTEIFDYKADSPFALFFKGLNFATTLPGRSLMTADEFFKGVNYRYELEALATREGIKSFDEALVAGKTSDEASAAFDDAINTIYSNPPEELSALAQEATFQKPMDGLAKKLQDAVNMDNPLSYIAKTQIPFISTPVNIQLQFLERTPFALLSSKIRADIAKGGKEGDLALSKIGMGTGFGYLMTGYATDGKLTGAGPADKGQREAMMRQGWQPYSLVFDFKDIPEEQKQKLSDMNLQANYGSGDYEGKVFVSYQGMEPIGSFLAMASNYTEFTKYEDDNSKINTQAAALAYGFYDYMMSNAFLQGISNISSALGMSYRPNQDDAVSLVTTLESSLLTFAQKSVTPLSGMVSSVREKIDPYQREYRIDPSYEGMVPAGVQEGINRVVNTTPGLSESLPYKLNMWGEPIEYEYTWSPIRMKEGKQGEADKIIIETGTKVRMPTKQISHQVEEGLSVSVDLTVDEYNEMLTIANDPGGINLQQRIVDVYQEIKDLPLYRQQQYISNTVEQSFTKARQILYGNSQYSSDIQMRIQDRAEIIREVGQGAK